MFEVESSSNIYATCVDFFPDHRILGTLEEFDADHRTATEAKRTPDLLSHGLSKHTGESISMPLQGLNGRAKKTLASLKNDFENHIPGDVDGRGQHPTRNNPVVNMPIMYMETLRHSTGGWTTKLLPDIRRVCVDRIRTSKLPANGKAFLQMRIDTKAGPTEDLIRRCTRERRH
jgi:hypothetical protein